MGDSFRSHSIVLLIAGLVFFLLYILLYPRPESVDDMGGHLIYLQDNIGMFFMKYYAETGWLKYPVPYYNMLPLNISVAFTPTDGTQFGGYIVPKYSLGIFLGSGALASLNANILLILIPLATVLSVICLYILIRNIFGDRIALMSALLAFIIPPVVIHGSRYCTIGVIPSILFMLLGFIYFKRMLKEKSCRDCFLSVLFLATAAINRYPDAIFIAPLLLYILIADRTPLKNGRLLITGAFTFLFVFSPILLLNKELYGSPFTSGYQSTANVIWSTTPTPGLAPSNILQYVVSFLGFDIEFFLSYINMYLVNVVPLLFFGSIIGFLYIWRTHSDNMARAYCLYMAYLFVAILLFYGGRITGGFNEFTIMASFIRYSLLFYILMLPLFAVILRRFAYTSKKAAVLFLSIFIILCTVNSVTLQNGIYDRYNSLGTNEGFYNSVIRNTEPNSAIIVLNEDRLLFPSRAVLLAPYLGVNYTSLDLKKQSFFKLPLNLTAIAQKAGYMANMGIPVYIVERIVDKDFKSALYNNGYKLKVIDLGLGYNKLYKLVVAEGEIHLPKA